MNLKMKLKSYNFWISLASVIMLLLRILGQRFGFEIDSNAFMDIVTALCGILVVLGIITLPVSTNSKTKKDQQQPQIDDKTGDEEMVQNAQNDTQNDQNESTNDEIEQQITNILDEVTQDKDISEISDKELFREVIESLAKSPDHLTKVVERMLQNDE